MCSMYISDLYHLQLVTYTSIHVNVKFSLKKFSLNHAETDAHFVFWRYLWMACWEVVNPGSLRVWHVAARRLRSNRQRRRLWKPWKGVFEKIGSFFGARYIFYCTRCLKD